jgi:uncharacterized protein (DUF983 family)
MKPIDWVFENVPWCYHGRLSRVFTINNRTYQVCLKCGHEFDYSWSRMRQIAAADVPLINVPLSTVRRAGVRLR